MPIVVGEHISQSLTRVGRVLFKPFQFGKWKVMAVGAAMTLIGEGGFSFNGSSRSSGGAGGGGGGGPSADEVTGWMHDHLLLIVVGAVGLILLFTPIYLLARWLSSRGQFIVLDNVVTNEARVRIPWSEYRAAGNSLFKLRILWDMIFFSYYLIALVISLAIAWSDIRNFLTTNDYEFTAHSGIAIAWMVLAVLVGIIPYIFCNAMIYHLAVPIMYLRGMNVWPALKVAWHEIFLPQKGPCLIYFLMMIVVAFVRGIWSGIGLLVFALVTCCIGLIWAIIPFIGKYPIAFIALPTIFFERIFALNFISQFGDAYHVPWRDPLEHGGFPVVVDAPPPTMA